MRAREIEVTLYRRTFNNGHLSTTFTFTLTFPEQPPLQDGNSHLRWLNTLFDICGSFALFSKTFDPLVTINVRKQVNDTNFVCFLSLN